MSKGVRRRGTLGFAVALAVSGVFLAALAALAQTPQDRPQQGVTAAGKPAEGRLEAFLGPARFDMQQLFERERFPNVVVALDGTVVATWGSQRFQVRRSEDAGATWEPATTIAEPGFHGGGALVDEGTGELQVFLHEKHPPTGGETAPFQVYRSLDHGRTWSPKDATILEDELGYVPALHMCEHGITLRHGAHAGRLLRPARVYGVRQGYNTALYSDDGGATWRPSAPFPEFGTGEGTVAELSDGRIYYNSRLHWDGAERPTKRRSAYSADGGATWANRRIVEVLPDGPQESAYGCMGGLSPCPWRGGTSSSSATSTRWAAAESGSLSGSASTGGRRGR